MYVSIGKAARMMGVSASTLRGWDIKKLTRADYRTEGRYRRYIISKLLEKIGRIIAKREKGEEKSNKKVRVVTYARVSSSKQKKRLGKTSRTFKSICIPTRMGTNKRIQ